MPPATAVAAAAAAHQPERVQTVRLASWNVKHLSDRTALSSAAKKDVAALVRVLQRFQFVALQEVTNAASILAKLCEELPGRWEWMVSPKVRQLNGKNSPECTAFMWDERHVQFTGRRDRKTGQPAGLVVCESDTSTPACHYFHRPPFFAPFLALVVRKGRGQ